MTKKKIGIISGLLVSILILFIPISGLDYMGQKVLAIMLFTVIWWATSVIHPAFTALICLTLLRLAGIEAEFVYGFFTSSTWWLIIASFFIAHAVRKVKLGERIGYFIWSTLNINTYEKLIYSIFSLNLVLAFILPNPFVRALLIYTLVYSVINDLKLNSIVNSSIGLAVFGSSIISSVPILTGDAVLNTGTLALAGVSTSWLEWSKYFFLPGLILIVGFMFIHTKFIYKSIEFKISPQLFIEKYNNLNCISIDEKKTIFWLALTLVLFISENITGIGLDQAAMVGTIGLTLPYLGVFELDDIKEGVDWAVVLFFLPAAAAIGVSGNIAGVNKWLGSLVFSNLNIDFMWISMIIVVFLGMLIHFIIGSALATAGVLGSIVSAYGTGMGWNPLLVSFLVYISVNCFYILPYHHVGILVGTGPAGYKSNECAKYGLFFVIWVLIWTAVIVLPWFKFMGLW